MTTTRAHMVDRLQADVDCLCNLAKGGEASFQSSKVRIGPCDPSRCRPGRLASISRSVGSHIALDLHILRLDHSYLSIPTATSKTFLDTRSPHARRDSQNI